MHVEPAEIPAHLIGGVVQIGEAEDSRFTPTGHQLCAVGGMLWMLKKARGDQKVLHWALALVAGGAVGNLIDRIYYGVVTDFILWHWGSGQPKGQPNRFNTEWPVFNVADIVLVVGVGLMFIDIQKEGKRDKAKKKSTKGMINGIRVASS